MLLLVMGSWHTAEVVTHIVSVYRRLLDPAGWALRLAIVQRNKGLGFIVLSRVGGRAVYARRLGQLRFFP